jgi:hypothetical protein
MAFKVVPLFAITSAPRSKPPVFVRIVVVTEAIYGAAQLLYVPTLLLPKIFGLVPLTVGEFSGALSVLVGMIWLVIAINLQHGDPKSRLALIAASLVRSLSSLAGLLISFASMLLLLLPQTSRQFFLECSKTEDTVG